MNDIVARADAATPERDVNTNDPRFRSLLRAALWWRDYAMNLREGRNVYPVSPYPPLHEWTPYPPPGITPEDEKSVQ